MDSLRIELQNSADDTAKVRIINEISYALSNTDPDEGLRYAREALALSEKVGWKKGRASAHANLGFNYHTMSDLTKALEHELKALVLYKSLGERSSVAAMEANIGRAYLAMSDYPRALEFSFDALEVYEELGDEGRKAIILENIGSIYFDQKNYNETLEYYTLASEAYKQLNDFGGYARCIGNIGRVYDAKGDFEEAMKRHQMALKVNEELQNINGQQINLANIGLVYSHMSDYGNALKYQMKALQLSNELGSRSSIAINLGNIGATYYAIAKNEVGADSLMPSGKAAALSKSITYLEEAIEICREVNFSGPQIEFTRILSDAYSELGEFAKALAYMREHMDLKDSVFSRQNQARIDQLETARMKDLAEKDLLLKNQQLEIAGLEVAQKRDELRFYIVSILLLLLVVGILGKTLYSYKKSHRELSLERKQHMELIEQQLSALKAHSKVLEEITYMQAHDIRGPVATILGLVELLDYDDLPDNETRQILSGISSITKKLDKAVRESIQKHDEVS